MSVLGDMLRLITHGLVCLSLCSSCARPSAPGHRVSTPTTVSQGRAPASSSAARDDCLAKPPSAGPFALSPDTPFALVTDGLDNVDLTVLDGVMVVSSAVPGSGSSYRLSAFQGGCFVATSPSPPVTKERNTAHLFGHWPADVWLSVRTVDAPGQQRHFLRWDGKAWELIPFPQPSPKVEPYQIFDWFDGAKLVAQLAPIRDDGLRIRIVPFLVWGSGAHQPPDFSKLSFPYETSDDYSSNIEFAMLPNRQVFVSRDITTDHGRTAVDVAYSTLDGKIVQDSVLDAAGGAANHLARGRLNGRDVVVAWGDARTRGQTKSWFRVYDGSSVQALSVPRGERSGFVEVWLAGGKLWARSDSREKLWVYDGAAWKLFADVSAGMMLAPADDGSVWAAYGFDLYRFDADGSKESVPFLAAPTKAATLLKLKVGALGDVWLRVRSSPQELVFRAQALLPGSAGAKSKSL